MLAIVVFISFLTIINAETSVSNYYYNNYICNTTPQQCDNSSIIITQDDLYDLDIPSVPIGCIAIKLTFNIYGMFGCNVTNPDILVLVNDQIINGQQLSGTCNCDVDGNDVFQVVWNAANDCHFYNNDEDAENRFDIVVSRGQICVSSIIIVMEYSENYNYPMCPNFIGNCDDIGGCGSFGQCVYDEYFGMSYCQCPTDFYGDNCEYYMDGCDTIGGCNDNSCFYSDSLDKGVCVCESGYWGEKCQCANNNSDIIFNAGKSFINNNELNLYFETPYAFSANNIRFKLIDSNCREPVYRYDARYDEPMCTYAIILIVPWTNDFLKCISEMATNANSVVYKTEILIRNTNINTTLPLSFKYDTTICYAPYDAANKNVSCPTIFVDDATTTTTFTVVPDESTATMIDYCIIMTIIIAIMVLI